MPPELDYFVYRAWGNPTGGGWMDWPAAEFAAARAAANVYVAMSGYRDASNKVLWCDANPAGWGVVSYVFALQEEEGVSHG